MSPQNNESGDLVAVYPNEHNAPTESSSSENSDRQSFTDEYNKPRRTPCPLCNFVGKCKMEYYAHLDAVHGAYVKLLRCNLCPFIALHKHHIDYHLSKHSGLKPYKCNVCVYRCVNQSMLKSHLKSHSNIRQYACNNCLYATSQLHSFKKHLRKYNHEPGRTLNPDGSLNTRIVIDVHGKRRGLLSKRRKSKTVPLQESRESSKSSSPSPPSTSNQLPSRNIQNFRNPQIYNNHNGNLNARPELSEAPSYNVPSLASFVDHPFKCVYCHKEAGSLEAYTSHMLSHANANQTIASNFNTSFPFCFPRNIDPWLPAHYSSESAWFAHYLNQYTTVEERKIGESMNTTKNDINTQSSSSAMNCYPLENKYLDKKESSSYGIAISSQMSPFNGYQYPDITGRKRKSHGIKLSTPSPNTPFTVKYETPKTMNGIFFDYNDNAPLDLSVKQPSSPETESNGFSSPYSQSGAATYLSLKQSSSPETKSNGFCSPYSQSSGAAMDLSLKQASSPEAKSNGFSSPYSWSPGSTTDRASTVSPTVEDVVRRPRANRRKGRAFKLNQYTVENDSVIDDIENESFSMQM